MCVLCMFVYVYVCVCVCLRVFVCVCECVGGVGSTLVALRRRFEKSVDSTGVKRSLV